MKKFFTLAMAACLSMAAYAQYTPGEDVTDKIAWRAYTASDEDTENPAWQGFNYTAGGSWEWHDVLEGVGEQISWGVYNVDKWNVYQEFEIEPGMYTLMVQGCYREGTVPQTFDLWAAGEKTKKCFVYVTVGEDTYKTPLMYFFTSESTEAHFTWDGWQSDNGNNYKNGVQYYAPSSHWGVDKWFEDGFFKKNEVLFVVPEKMTIRVGIDKPLAQSQDQAWWDNWSMIYEGPYNDEAKAVVAAKTFEVEKENAETFIFTVQDTYGALGALMYDEIGEIEIENPKSLESVNEAIAAIKAADALNRVVFTKTQGMEKNLDICKGIAQVTEFAGKAAFESAINTANALLYSDELDEDTELQTFIDAADALAKGRIDYLLTQEKGIDGSYDFTHALAFPYWVNQENTGWHDADGYHYPQNVQDALNSCNDGADGNLEKGEGKNNDGAVTFEAVSSKAHWTVDGTMENQWVYDDQWNGWHGGMQPFIQKLKGYAGINSDWSVGANPGGMWVYQNLSALPDGFYTLEGNVWHNAQGGDEPNTWASNNNNYMYIKDANGNEIAKVMQETESRGYWDGYGSDMYTVLKTDFVEIKGGKAQVGYHNNTWMLNSIMVLKYYGAEIDYTGILQQKIADAAPGENDLWPGDLITYNEMIAKVVFPIGGKDAYDEAVAIVNAAIAFKNYANGITGSFNVPQQYLEIQNNYEDGTDQHAIIDVAWGVVINLGNGENDSYTDAQKAIAIYNKYVEYIAAFDDAVANYYTAGMQAVIAKQVADLKSNYASVETLEKYMGEIATEKNAAIFEQMCANATEANPVDITEKYVKNPSLAEGPKTGWTLTGDNDPSCNTYGRQLAENWNRKAFEISQTLYEMPAGTYELRVRACYRAGGVVDENMVNATADESFAYNAQLFANGYEVNVASVCDNGEGGQGWEDPSFSVWYNGWEVREDLPTNMGLQEEGWSSTVCVTEGEYAVIAAAWEDDMDKQDALVALQSGIKEMNLEQAGEQYPFDTNVNGKYYPSSMAGFQERCAKSPNAYVNKVQAYLPETGTLKIGLRKNDGVGSDWLIYDDFQLFYLGAAPSTGITDVNTEGASKAIYNVAGQRVNALQKGINIVGGKKIYVK